jgi:hypothetical protein
MYRYSNGVYDVLYNRAVDEVQESTYKTILTRTSIGLPKVSLFTAYYHTKNGHFRQQPDVGVTFKLYI